jgi:hypothetical protein
MRVLATIRICFLGTLMNGVDPLDQKPKMKLRHHYVKNRLEEIRLYMILAKNMSLFFHSDDF